MIKLSVTRAHAMLHTSESYRPTNATEDQLYEGQATYASNAAGFELIRSCSVCVCVCKRAKESMFVRLLKQRQIRYKGS